MASPHRPADQTARTSPAESAPGARRNGGQTIGSVANALRVLQAFTLDTPELGIAELARELALSKATVHAVLATLVQQGFADRNPVTRRYRLGLKAFEVGNVALQGLGLG